MKSASSVLLFMIVQLSVYGCSDEEDCQLGLVTARDADADGLCNDVDPCPMDLLNDRDGDGSCDSSDVCAGNDRSGDTDGDGLCDDTDPCPLDAPPSDSDGDGVCNAYDLCQGHDASGDRDADGACDNVDPCVGTGPDTDGDGTCDDVDLCVGIDLLGDADGDGICGDIDLCMGNDGAGDSDGDGTCDDQDLCMGFTDEDADGDGWCDDQDPCPELSTVAGECTAPPAGAVHFWTGDGHFRDMIGQAHAMPVGGVSALVPAQNHRGFELGYGDVTRLILPNAVANGATDFSVAMWVLTADDGFGLFSAAGARSDNEVLLFVRHGEMDVYVAGAVQTLEVDITDLLWHHVALVRQGDTGLMTLYVDGVAAPSWSTVTGPLLVASLLFGQEQDTIGGGFQASQAMQGRLDEILWYDRALSSDEVGALAGAASLCTPGAVGRDVIDLPLNGIPEVYLPLDSPCRNVGTAEVADSTPLMPPGWWTTQTTSANQSLDVDPPDYGRHYYPLGLAPP